MLSDDLIPQKVSLEHLLPESSPQPGFADVLDVICGPPRDGGPVGRVTGELPKVTGRSTGRSEVARPWGAGVQVSEDL